MRYVISAVAVAAMGLALAGCFGKKDPGKKAPGAAASGPAAAAPASMQPMATIDLCVDPSDLQIEPLDLEAMDDELPTAPASGAIADVLAGFTEHGSPAPLGGGGVVLPFLRCQEGGGCSAGVVALEPSGAARATVPLPALATPGPGLELVTALADVSSDGREELWVGYREGRPDAPPSVYHVAAFSLPDLALEWHGAVSQAGMDESDDGCEGALYAVDGDCDGDGDVLLVQRCGPMGCMGSESSACKGPRGLVERVIMGGWDGSRGGFVSALGVFKPAGP